MEKFKESFELLKKTQFVDVNQMFQLFNQFLFEVESDFCVKKKKRKFYIYIIAVMDPNLRISVFLPKSYSGFLGCVGYTNSVETIEERKMILRKHFEFKKLTSWIIPSKLSYNHFASLSPDHYVSEIRQRMGVILPQNILRKILILHDFYSSKKYFNMIEPSHWIIFPLSNFPTENFVSFDAFIGNNEFRLYRDSLVRFNQNVRILTYFVEFNGDENMIFNDGNSEFPAEEVTGSSRSLNISLGTFGVDIETKWDKIFRSYFSCNNCGREIRNWHRYKCSVLFDSKNDDQKELDEKSKRFFDKSSCSFCEICVLYFSLKLIVGEVFENEKFPLIQSVKILSSEKTKICCKSHGRPIEYIPDDDQPRIVELDSLRKNRNIQMKKKTKIVRILEDYLDGLKKNSGILEVDYYFSKGITDERISQEALQYVQDENIEFNSEEEEEEVEEEEEEVGEEEVVNLSQDALDILREIE